MQSIVECIEFLKIIVSDISRVCGEVFVVRE